jgi:DnaJ-class molecular chaperone
MVTIACPRCDGSETLTERCPVCLGQPEIFPGKCPLCEGEGWVETECPECGGTGEVNEQN